MNGVIYSEACPWFHCSTVQKSTPVHQVYVLRLSFSQLTCKLSIGGITMTKLSGKKPQRPFSCPSHQPSSAVSFRRRLKSHFKEAETSVRPLGSGISDQKVTEKSSGGWLVIMKQPSLKEMTFLACLDKCHISVFKSSQTTGLSGRTIWYLVRKKINQQEFISLSEEWRHRTAEEENASK